LPHFGQPLACFPAASCRSIRQIDAIAVALRAGAPIFIDSVLLDRLEEARKEAEGDLPAFPTSTVIDTGETTVH